MHRLLLFHSTHGTWKLVLIIWCLLEVTTARRITSRYDKRQHHRIEEADDINSEEFPKKKSVSQCRKQQVAEFMLAVSHKGFDFYKSKTYPVTWCRMRRRRASKTDREERVDGGFRRLFKSNKRRSRKYEDELDKDKISKNRKEDGKKKKLLLARMRRSSEEIKMTERNTTPMTDRNITPMTDRNITPMLERNITLMSERNTKVMSISQKHDEIKNGRRDDSSSPRTETVLPDEVTENHSNIPQSITEALSNVVRTSEQEINQPDETSSVASISQDGRRSEQETNQLEDISSVISVRDAPTTSIPMLVLEEKDIEGLTVNEMAAQNRIEEPSTPSSGFEENTTTQNAELSGNSPDARRNELDGTTTIPMIVLQGKDIEGLTVNEILQLATKNQAGSEQEAPNTAPENQILPLSANIPEGNAEENQQPSSNQKSTTPSTYQAEESTTPDQYDNTAGSDVKSIDEELRDADVRSSLRTAAAEDTSKPSSANHQFLELNGNIPEDDTDDTNGDKEVKLRHDQMDNNIGKSAGSIEDCGKQRSANEIDSSHTTVATSTEKQTNTENTSSSFLEEPRKEKNSRRNSHHRSKNKKRKRKSHRYCRDKNRKSKRNHSRLKKENGAKSLQNVDPVNTELSMEDVPKFRFMIDNTINLPEPTTQGSSTSEFTSASPSTSIEDTTMPLIVVQFPDPDIAPRLLNPPQTTTTTTTKPDDTTHAIKIESTKGKKSLYSNGSDTATNVNEADLRADLVTVTRRLKKPHNSTAAETLAFMLDNMKNNQENETSTKPEKVKPVKKTSRPQFGAKGEKKELTQKPNATMETSNLISNISNQMAAQLAAQISTNKKNETFIKTRLGLNLHNGVGIRKELRKKQTTESPSASGVGNRISVAEGNASSRSNDSNDDGPEKAIQGTETSTAYLSRELINPTPDSSSTVEEEPVTSDSNSTSRSSRMEEKEEIVEEKVQRSLEEMAATERSNSDAHLNGFNTTANLLNSTADPITETLRQTSDGTTNSTISGAKNENLTSQNNGGAKLKNDTDTATTDAANVGYESLTNSTDPGLNTTLNNSSNAATPHTPTYEDASPTTTQDPEVGIRFGYWGDGEEELRASGDVPSPPSLDNFPIIHTHVSRDLSFIYQVEHTRSGDNIYFTTNNGRLVQIDPREIPRMWN